MRKLYIISLLGMMCVSASACDDTPRLDGSVNKDSYSFMGDPRNGRAGYDRRVSQSGQKSVSGPARVIDGDTLVVESVHVRLYGIDAPEKAQMCQKHGLDYECGVVATAHMTDMTYGKTVTCDAVPGQRDRYGRMIGKCSTSDISDLNDRMVRSGQALAYRRYSMDYAEAEDEAHTAKRGVWSGTFVNPWDWRRGVK